MTDETLPCLVGMSPAMDAVRTLMHQAIDGAAPILITGGPGTGKKLCAAIIERSSPAKDRTLRIGRKRRSASELLIHLPPLSARGAGDIGDLLDYYGHLGANKAGRRFPGFDAAALDALRAYPWPGNVAELVMTVTGLTKRARMSPFGVDALPDHILAAAIPPFEETEKRAITHAIRHCGGNVSRAASLLRISPMTIYRRLSDWKDAP